MSSSVPSYESVILRQHLEEIRFRMLATSSVNLPGDRDMIHALYEQAHDLGDTDLELYTFNNYALTYLMAGELDHAHALFAEGMDLAITYKNEGRWLTSRLNQGIILMLQRDLVAARKVFEESLPRLKAVPVNADNVTKLHLAYCYLGLVCADLHDYEAAEKYARSFLDVWEMPELAFIQQVRRIEMMSMARDAMSAVYLARGEYAQARSQAGLMLGLSVRQVYPLQTISAYLALLRVSVFSSNSMETNADWQHVVQAVAPLLESHAPVLWRIATQAMMREAYLYQHHGITLWARRCAQKAVEMLAAVGHAEYRQRAESFLAQLPNP